MAVDASAADLMKPLRCIASPLLWIMWLFTPEQQSSPARNQVMDRNVVYCLLNDVGEHDPVEWPIRIVLLPLRVASFPLARARPDWWQPRGGKIHAVCRDPSPCRARPRRRGARRASTCPGQVPRPPDPPDRALAARRLGRCAAALAG